MKSMTEKQKEVYQYLQLSSESGNPQPSIKEMAEFFEVTEPAIHSRLELIEKKGYINRTSKARSIEICGGAR